jgi:cytochrome c-type biogenesis protein CcmH/NrfG
MNSNTATPAKRRFQLLRGFGAQEKKEAEQLDHFLVATDPVLLASLQTEERSVRRQRLRWGLAALLALTAVVPVLWLTGGLLYPASEGLAGKAAPDTEAVRSLMEEARQQMAQARYNEALENALLATQAAPGLAETWILLGDCQMKNYQSALSEEAFRKALALEPGSSRALLGLGTMYLRRGEERKAEEVWLRGGLDGKLAGLYLLQGRFREAEVRLRPLIAEGTEEELLYRMAEAARSRRLDPGLRSLLEPEPAGLSEWADLGWRLARQERHEEAAEAFHKAVTLVPRDVNALSGLGLSLLALDRTGEARSYFDRALRLDHDHVLSLNGLAQCLKEEGRTGEAIAVWQTMAQLYPGVNYGTPGLAWTYYEIQDYPQAAVHLARLVRRYPYDVRVIDALNIAVENIGSMPMQPN